MKFVGDLTAGECFVAFGRLWIVVVPNTKGVVYARGTNGEDKEFPATHRVRVAKQAAFLKAEEAADAKRDKDRAVAP